MLYSLIYLIFNLACVSNQPLVKENDFKPKMEFQSENQNQDKLPDWVNSPKKKYPDAFFLVGLGISEIKSDAENQAYENIAKVFSVTIKVDENIERKISEMDSDEKSTFENSLNVLKQSRVSTDQTLTNARLAETFYSETEKKYYVLAVMEKEATGEIISNKIDENQSKINNWIKSTDSENDAFRKVQLMSKAKTLFAIVKNMYEMLDVLTYSFPKEKINESQLEKKFQEVFSQCPVFLEIDQNVPKKLSDQLRKKLTGNGYQIGKNKNKSALTLQCEYQTEEFDRPGNPAKFISWNFAIKFIHTADDQEIAVYQKDGKSSQLSISAAKQKAESQISKLIDDELDSFLKNAF